MITAVDPTSDKCFAFPFLDFFSYNCILKIYAIPYSELRNWSILTKLFFKDSPYLPALNSGQLYNQSIRLLLRYFAIYGPKIFLMYTSMSVKYSKQRNLASIMCWALGNKSIFHMLSPPCIKVGLPHISLVAKEKLEKLLKELFFVLSGVFLIVPRESRSNPRLFEEMHPIKS